MVKLVAFAGYARAGKDVASSALVGIGYTKVAFGDIIKRYCDPLVQEKLGFSAFTENDDQKKLIRPLLETAGDVFYDSVMEDFFSTLPEKAVNGRIVREREAREWVRRGGIILEIRRPGFGPATEWERQRLEELRDTGLITGVIETGDKGFLQAAVVSYVTSTSLPGQQLAA